MKRRIRELSANLAGTIRADQWWDYKLVPIYSVFYATVYLQHISVASVWSSAVALLLAIAPCAAYVSLSNDLADRDDDRRAGKFNRLAGKPVGEIILLLAAPLCAAVFFTVLWRDDLPLVVAYLCTWAAFSLYSLPPIRLKSRGLAGLVADACGSHVFPSLVAVLLAERAASHTIDEVWIAAIAVWALGCGLRGILWHQLYDCEADRRAGVQTFVLRHSRRAAVRLARFALVIELVALSVVLWRIKSAGPVVFLLIYAVFAILKSRLWKVRIVVAEPSDQYAILGMEYYTLLFPLAVVLSCAIRDPADWMVVFVHLIVFRRPAILFFKETPQLSIDCASAWRQNAVVNSSEPQ
jgi:1,4-dihydroxy-2-naphthoate octaprenyltransferase